MGKFIGDNLPDLGVLIVLIFIFWILQRYLLKYISKKYIQHLNKNNMKLRSQIVVCYEKQIRYFIFTLSTFIAANFILKYDFFDNTIALNLMKCLGFIFFFTGLINICSSVDKNSVALKEHYSLKIENIMLSFFSKIVKVLLIFILFGLVAYQWGYDINGLIAGLGIGGLAIALGAKDLLSNIFGGIAIVFDKPFSIGDWISTDKDIEGHVEDINFRSTRIRTFDKSIIYIPNSLLANQPIYNMTRRNGRRIRFFVSLSQDTSSEKVITIIERIRTFIINNENIENDKLYIAFDQITQQGIDILIQYHSKTVDYSEVLKIKQEVNFEILRIVNEENCKITIPSQNIHIYQE